MRIPRQLQFTRIEAVLSELEGAGSYVLTTSPDNSYQALGGETALVQAYVTWSQQEAQPHIRLSSTAPLVSDQAVDRLAPLCAALVANKISFGDRNVTEPVLNAALARIALLQGSDPRSGSRGPQIEIVCADHLGRSFPTTLYDFSIDSKPTPKPESGLSDLTGKIARATMPAEQARGETAELELALAGALYELFRNTHEHARHDLAGNFIKRSLRAVQARRHSITPRALARIAEDTPALAAYCRRLQPRPGRAQLQLLEVSVLDSGPGLAARWLGRELTAADRGGVELDAVKACFAKGASTKPRPGAGMGLPNLIDVGRKSNGFLRLRTGAQSLCADLGAEGEQPLGTTPGLVALHGERIIARASGTLWTLLLPIREPA